MLYQKQGKLLHTNNIENGNLDMGKLLNSVQSIMGQGGQDGGLDLSGMLSGLTDMVENSGGVDISEDLPERTKLPDPKMIMGMMDMFVNKKE